MATLRDEIIRLGGDPHVLARKLRDGEELSRAERDMIAEALKDADLAEFNRLAMPDPPRWRGH